MRDNLNQSIYLNSFRFRSKPIPLDSKDFSLHKTDKLKHVVFIYIIKEHIPTLYQPGNEQQGLCEKYCQQEIYDQL